MSCYLQVPIFMRVEAARVAARAASSGADDGVDRGTAGGPAAGANGDTKNLSPGSSAAPRRHITRSPQMGQARAEAQLQVRNGRLSQLLQ